MSVGHQRRGAQMFHSDTGEMLDSDVRETAWRKNISGSINSSGGGFSNVFPIPAYQVQNVASYKHIENRHLKAMQDRFNGTGRAYPDVAARADSYRIVLDEKWKLVGGTSASTPVFASMITLINSERMHTGKGQVGFLNPDLYANPEVLNDIDTGENEGCGFNSAFRATRGWDAVTGLGSPDYKRMRKLFMSLP